jgi:phosphoglycerate dehydrogenase-like enzyme
MPVLLCSEPFTADQVQALRGAEVHLARDPEEFLRALPEAELVVGRMQAPHFTAARRMRWLQVPHAGVDKFPLAELRARGVVLTNIRGIQAPAVADHTMMLLLGLTRGLPDCVRARDRGEYPRPERVGDLTGARALVAGFGAIGHAVAQRLRAHEVHVIAMRRRPAPDPLADQVIGPEQLLAVLPTVDFVISCLPNTPATAGLLGARAIAAMKEGAIVLNMSRAEVWDEDAVVAALKSGRLGAAAADSFHSYPLPAGHPFYTAPRFVITPHNASAQRNRLAQVHALVAHNLERFLAGDIQGMRGLIDLEAGY